MYRAYGLLLANSDFSLERALSKLTERFPQYSVTRATDQITVASPDWEIELLLNSSPDVLTESIGFAEKIAGGDGLYLEKVDRRVEVWSDTPDPEVEHLDDVLGVIDILKSFTGIVVIDPKEPALM